KVTEHTMQRIQEVINTELSQLLNRIANQGGVSLEEDIRLFNQSVRTIFSHWKLEVAVNVSEKSGDNRHSFNNYVKSWMESSKANPFKRLNVNDINEEIAKQKNSIEFLFSFFSPNKQRFSHHDLRTFVRDTRDKFEAVESRKEENKIFTQRS